ncbi:hypothetical protein ACYSNX_01255 [Myroides sp. LJL115]
MSFVSCQDKKSDVYYQYGTKEYRGKEDSLKINTEEAAELLATYYFNENPEAEHLNLELDVIFNDYYVFSDKVILYNAKSGDYSMEGTYWINGITKQIKKSDKKSVKMLLQIPKVGFVQEFKNK